MRHECYKFRLSQHNNNNNNIVCETFSKAIIGTDVNMRLMLSHVYSTVQRFAKHGISGVWTMKHIICCQASEMNIYHA